LAVCNDGSSAVYYFRKGYNPELWLMYLQGGPSCYDQNSCGAQPEWATTGHEPPHSVYLGGIFSDASPMFADANLVWVAYCTSDSWAGDTPGPPGARNLTEVALGAGSFAGFPGGFRGQRVVAATLQSMRTNLAFGSALSTRLLFGGCTPGALLHLDGVAAWVRGQGLRPEMVSVQGLLDSAAVLDIAPLAPGQPSLANLTQQAYAYVNASGAPSPLCTAAFPEAPWRCLLGAEALPYVQTPYLLAQSQFDRAQLAYNAPRPGASPASAAYAGGFQNASRALLRGLPTAAQKSSALYAPSCFAYCTSLSAAFWNTASPGGSVPRLGGRLPPSQPAQLSLAEAVQLWFFKAAKELRLEDPCTGFRCGRCHANNRAGKHGEPALVATGARNAGPILLGLFALLTCCGCCLACASAAPQRRAGGRSLLRGGLAEGEDTPLLPRQGVVSVPKAAL